MNEIVVFGTADFAQVADFYFSHDSPYRVAGFTADREYVDSDTFQGKPLVPFDAVVEEFPPSEYGMFIAVGYSQLNELRERKFNEAKEKGYTLVSYLCSESTYWGEADIGENCFIFEDQTIQPFVDIGDNVVIWSGNHIGHHVMINDHCFISSHCVLSGSVEIGSHCFLGVNSTYSDDVTIGEKSVIGAGATIVDDVEPESVYIGQAAEYHRDSTDVQFGGEGE